MQPRVVFLAHKTTDIAGSVKLGLGVLIGFLSHLVMDELWSVDLNGLRVHLKKSAGSAWPNSWAPGLMQTLMRYVILAALSYLVGVREGFFAPVQLPFATLRAATLQP